MAACSRDHDELLAILIKSTKEAGQRADLVPLPFALVPGAPLTNNDSFAAVVASLTMNSIFMTKGCEECSRSLLAAMAHVRYQLSVVLAMALFYGMCFPFTMAGQVAAAMRDLLPGAPPSIWCTMLRIEFVIDDLSTSKEGLWPLLNIDGPKEPLQRHWVERYRGHFADGELVGLHRVRALFSADYFRFTQPHAVQKWTRHWNREQVLEVDAWAKESATTDIFYQDLAALATVIRGTPVPYPVSLYDGNVACFAGVKLKADEVRSCMPFLATASARMRRLVVLACSKEARALANCDLYGSATPADALLMARYMPNNDTATALHFTPSNHKSSYEYKPVADEETVATLYLVLSRHAASYEQYREAARLCPIADAPSLLGATERDKMAPIALHANGIRDRQTAVFEQGEFGMDARHGPAYAMRKAAHRCLPPDLTDLCLAFALDAKTYARHRYRT